MKYFLAEACQNTFVLWDCLHCPDVDAQFLESVYHYLVKEDKDDALILVGGKKSGDAYQARMLVLGQDGALAEFCGNGSRVCAAYLFEHYPHVKQFNLLSSKGIHPLHHVKPKFYSIQLPPACFEPNPKFITNPKQLPEGLVYVEIIEPHLILQDNVSDEELFSIGQELNQRKDLFPLGINVNAWDVIEEGRLFVKTYERGVQRLTKSCGTGSISCAAFHQAQGTVSVQTPGGLLTVTLNNNVIFLQGPAHYWEKGAAA